MNPLDYYLNVVNMFYCMYFDAMTGFMSLHQLLVQTKERVLLESGMEEAEYDNREFVYGVGGHDVPNSVKLASCKMKEHIKRNEKDGLNQVIMGNSLAVILYEIWENTTRNQLAEQLGIHRDKITSDVFGDLRHIRTSIVHNKSIASSDVAKCKVLTMFKPGEDIVFGQWPFQILIETIRQECEVLRKQYNLS